MQAAFDYVRKVRRSRYFLPGVVLGVVIGAGAASVWFLMSPAMPQWRPGGSALAPTMVKVATPSPSDAIVHIKPGATIVCEGDSLTYGFARSWGPSQPGINGYEARRSLSPYPETLEKRLGAGVKVVNRGVPGQRTLEGLYRWADASSGDLAIIMYGTNDAAVRGNAQPMGVGVYGSLLEALVRRRLYGGAKVILLVPPPASARNTQPMLDPYRQAVVEVGARTGVLVIDTAEAMTAADAPLQADGLHLRAETNVAIAEAIARRIAVDRGSGPSEP
jgi:lysophospholipase L1-like esterase